MKFQLASVLLTAILIISSCEPSNDVINEDNESGTAAVQFKLTDFPADYEAVLIHVTGLEYKLEAEDEEDDSENEESEEENEENGDDGEEEEEEDNESDSRIFRSTDDGEDDDEGTWTAVEIDPTVYDLLELNNGVEALLADIEMPIGELEGVRLILGDSNYVVIDGDSLKLTVPSGSESGLKIKVDSDIEADEEYEITLDFDAARSIVKAGLSGKYLLKPVIRVSITEVEGEEIFGSISGVVTPIELSTKVYAIDDEEDTVSAIPEENGAFLIEMLETGDYSVVAVPDDETISPITVAPVGVMEGEVTELDTIKFE